MKPFNDAIAMRESVVCEMMDELSYIKFGKLTISELIDSVTLLAEHTREYLSIPTNATTTKPDKCIYTVADLLRLYAKHSPSPKANVLGMIDTLICIAFNTLSEIK